MKEMDIRAVSGVDRLGRRLPLSQEVSPLRQNRYVGIFYFLWLGQEGTDGPFDVEKILAEDPRAAYDVDHPLWGKRQKESMLTLCHWGEPLWGYYFSNDEWVVRRHAEMLGFADVDFVVFDTTNGPIFKENALTVMRVFSEYLAAGYKVPQVVFMTNAKGGKNDCGDVVEEIYREIYAKNFYPDTWFMWDGKPLILGRPEECSVEAQAFFSFRRTQWPMEKQEQGGFSWMEFVRPQRVYRKADGTPEMINVSVAQHPNCAHSDSAFFGEKDTWGRSYHNGAMDVRYRAVDWGFNVQEQWDYAIQKDPEIIFLTGWNEWIAGRWDWDRDYDFDYTLQDGEGETHEYSRPRRTYIHHTMCDCCTEEYSRDIEPMKGGYFDNYYLQMIANIRRFKGLPEMPKDERRGEWSNGIGYRDFPFGNAHRDCRGFGDYHYVNTSGVNDIAEMTVSSCEDAVKFTATCADDIQTVGSWMRLYVRRADRQCYAPLGFEWTINDGTNADGSTAVSKWNGAAYQTIGRAQISVDGKSVTVTVEKALLGFKKGECVSIDFKWTDQVGENPTVEDFYQNGDSAPLGRLSYRYEEA